MMKCESCKKGTEPVPYIVHESAMARQERTIRRLVCVIVLLIVLLSASVAFTVWRETQFETVSVEQDNDIGVNNFIGNDGEIYNGEAKDYIP